MEKNKKKCVKMPDRPEIIKSKNAIKCILVLNERYFIFG
jgi:hypothetical protein